MDEKIEVGGYIMTIPLGAMKVKRRFRDSQNNKIYYEVTSSNPTDTGSFVVLESQCRRRATETEYKKQITKLR